MRSQVNMLDDQLTRSNAFRRAVTDEVAELSKAAGVPFDPVEDSPLAGIRRVASVMREPEPKGDHTAERAAVAFFVVFSACLVVWTVVMLSMYVG